MALTGIKKFIDENDNFAIIGHINPDGDCIGSCLGLWHLLKKLGKTASVLIKSDDVPHFLKFLWEEEAEAKDGQTFDAYIAVDCATVDRLGAFSKEFLSFEKTACIDHHRTNTGFGSAYAVLPACAAAGEIIYCLADEVMGITPKGKMAEKIFAAIVSDTGGFKYSSVTPRTMTAGAKLIEAGVDHAAIYKKLFDTYTEKQINIVGDITATLETYFEGKCAAITVTEELLQSHGMRFDDVDFITNLPRSIEGVEVGVYFKKKADEVKVSLRSGEYVDVSQIATQFGGGGHIRAAGVTLKCSLEEAKSIIFNEIKKVI